jgi:fido (protein-threonine AMPylation protein)
MRNFRAEFLMLLQILHPFRRGRNRFLNLFFTKSSERFASPGDRPEYSACATAIAREAVGSPTLIEGPFDR